MSVKREMTRKPPCYGHSAAKNENRAAVHPAEFVCVICSYKSTSQHLEGKDVFLHIKNTTGHQQEVQSHFNFQIAASDGQTNSAGILRASPKNRSGEWGQDRGGLGCLIFA